MGEEDTIGPLSFFLIVRGTWKNGQPGELEAEGVCSLDDFLHCLQEALGELESFHGEPAVRALRVRGAGRLAGDPQADEESGSTAGVP